MVSFFQKFISLLLSFALSISPAISYAGGVIVDSSAPKANQATLDKAQNGIDVINITKPSPAGVSLNHFSEFNTPKAGNILNNSIEFGVSQLGGALGANPNFGTGSAADVIISEVTGRNPSDLRGYTEIFGKKAEYIFLNSNGISCNECGFINLDKLTLGTGRSGFDSAGNLRDIHIGDGTITIGEAGANFSNISYVDLVSRYFELKDQLFVGGDLGIYTGNDKFDFQNKEISSTDSAAAPVKEYAIDGSVIGSMYGSRVKMIASENGLGVKYRAGVTANVGEFFADVGGDFEYEAIESKGNLTIDAAGDIKQNNSAVSEASINLTSGGKIELSGEKVGAAGKIEILAEEEVKFNSVDLNSKSAVKITSNEGAISNSGRIAAQGDLTIVADEINNSSTLELLEDGSYSKLSGILTSGNLDISGNITNDSGYIYSGNNAILNGLNNENGVVEIAGNFDVVTDGDFNNKKGIIFATGEESLINIKADSLLNGEGKIESENDIFIKLLSADSYNLDSIISSEHEINFKTAGDLVINKDYSSSNLLFEAVGNITSNAAISAAEKLELIITKATESGVSASSSSGMEYSLIINDEIISESDLTLSSVGNILINANIVVGKFADPAIIGSVDQGSFTISGVTIDNKAELSAVLDVTINSTNFNNHGRVLAGNDLLINADNSIKNNANKLIFSVGNLSLLANNKITNDQGEIYSHEGDILLANKLSDKNNGVENISGDIKDSGSIISHLGDINIHTKYLENKRSVINYTSGFSEEFVEFVDRSNLPMPDYVPGGAMRNYMNIGRGRALVEEVYYSGYGFSFADSGINLSINEGKMNEISLQEALISSGKNLNIYADTVSNKASSIKAKGDLLISGSVLNNYTYNLYRTVLAECVYWEVCRGWNNKTKNFYYQDGRFKNNGVQITNNDNGSVDSYIQAGGKFTGNFRSRLNNETIGEQVSGINRINKNEELDSREANIADLTSGSGLAIDIDITKGVGSFFSINEIIAPEFTYLIETNNKFIDLSRFIGSKYYLDRAGFDLDRDIKLAGDGYWEQRRLQKIMDDINYAYDAVNFNDVVTNLYDNAYDLVEEYELQDIELSPGVTLSKEVIANLKKNVLWLEEQEINGVRVWVPTLYLAVSNIEALAQENEHLYDAVNNGGSVIAANEIELTIDGDLETEGAISSKTSTIIMADSVRQNNNALLNSSGDLSLIVAGDILNESSRINSAGALSVIADNIINETKVYTEEIGENIYSDIVNTASISGGSLDVATSGDFINKGANLSANTGDAILDVGGDFTLETIALRNKRVQRFKNGYRISDKIKNIGTELEIAGDLTINSNNAILTSSKIKAAGDIEINAEGVLAILTSQDVDYLEVQHTDEGSLTTSTENYGHNKRTANYTELTGNNIKLNSNNIIADIVEDRPSEYLNYLESTKDSANITYNYITEIDDSWYNKSRGLNEVGTAIVTVAAVAVTVVTAGAGSGVSAAMMTAAASTAAATASTAAVNASMNADGDIFKQIKDTTKTTWDETTSKESVQNIAISAATAAITAGGTSGLDKVTNGGFTTGNYANATLPQKITTSLAESAISTTASTATQSAINGESFTESLESQGENILIGAASNLAAKEIGQAYKTDKINKPAQLALHATLGCASAAAGGKTCASGAVSGVMGEITAEVADKNLGLSKEGIKELSGVTGGLSAIVTGGLTGQSNKEIAENIYSGSRIGKNAAENNYLSFVHGTNSSPEDADPEFLKALEETFGEEVRLIEWSGDNTREARIEGGGILLDDIKKHYKEGDPIHIVSHSHGGNVVKEFSQIYQGDKDIDTVVFLGTPHRDDHALNYNILADDANLINLYDRQDGVQTKGHSDSKNIVYAGLKSFFIGNKASQDIQGFYNMEIYQTESIVVKSKKADYRYIFNTGVGSIDSHLLLDTSSIWNQYIKPEIK